MYNKSGLQQYTFGDHTAGIIFPGVPEQLPHASFPYWATIWPAAIGLCHFLQKHTFYIRDKKILELAAGLGLPGIYSAALAAEVMLSDAEEKAVYCMEQSVQHNKLLNVRCSVIDWNRPEAAGIPDIVLLSDVNYEPSVFSALMHTLHYFMDRHCTIILSTPERLMAKAFITPLLPYCIQQESFTVVEGTTTFVSVFVLSKQQVQKSHPV